MKGDSSPLPKEEHSEKHLAAASVADRCAQSVLTDADSFEK